MSKSPDVQKSLDRISANEKGWQKVLATAEGSYSRSFASEQLRRLAVERNTLLSQIANDDSNSAPNDGIAGGVQHG
jgi:hypothetical protein